MLVLSRRLDEKVVLPGIGTTITVLAVQRGQVRLGIDAPPAVAVHRGEVCQRDPRLTAAGPELLQDSNSRARLHELNHLLRNRLNAGAIALALARRQLQAGQTQSALITLDRMDQEHARLRTEVERAAEPPAPPPTRGRRALLVEDDQNERELLAGFLRLAGLQVATAGDGCDALDYLKANNRPDIVLLDMMLPRCDGAQTVRAIRGDRTLDRLKVIAISGHEPAHFGLNESSGLVDRWIRKPCNPEALLRELEAELNATP